MADPRLSVDFKGIGAVYASFKIDNSTIVYSATAERGSAVVDRAVTMSADDTVALVADGGHVVGKLIQVEPDGIATVQVKGFMEFGGGTSATLTRGTAIVGALLSSVAGYIRSAASGTAAELILCTGQIIRNGDTTKVVVKL